MKFQPKKMDYSAFVNDIFKFLQKDERNELFYCSLFDPSSWEEIVERQRMFLNFQKNTERRIIRLLKGKIPSFKKYMGSKIKKEYFLESFVYTGDLCVFMLAAALREKTVEIPFKTISGQGFPDFIICAHGIPKAGVEVKRLIGCSNLKERIDDEVISSSGWGGIDKLLLLLIFPAVGEDDPFRIHQLTGGYYVFEDYIKSKIQGEKTISVLCRCIPSRPQNSKYSFESLVNDVLDYYRKQVFKGEI